jgi:hypothetical protein
MRFRPSNRFKFWNIKSVPSLASSQDINP